MSALQCCIDLKDDVLKIGTTGNNAPFLKESELKEMEEMEKKQAVSSRVLTALQYKITMSVHNVL